MTAQIKITQLTEIGNANIATTTLLPVVKMTGVPVTQKTTLGNLANVILGQSGGNYVAANIANLAYSIVNAAQPNITSIGTLTTLTVSGNVDLGNVANIKITGGSSGQILSTDGNGNLSWVADANSVYGNSNVSTFLANYGSNTITTTGNVSIGNIIGNGQALTGLAGANVTGTVANANFAMHVDVQSTTNNFSYHVVLVQNPGDNHLQLDGDDQLQYNPNSGVLTSYRIDATYFVGNLFYSSGLSASNVAGLGNIATINKDGNASNILYGNGVFASAPTSGYGDSNVVTLLGSFGSNTITTTGNISIGNIVGNTNGHTLGYLNIPQVSASNTTLTLSDAGKHYYSTTAGNITLTIPLNSSEPFATGTAISIVVQAAGNVLVNAASGVTLYMAGSSSAGNRVVGTYGMATLMKVASDTWFINGTGVY